MNVGRVSLVTLGLTITGAMSGALIGSGLLAVLGVLVDGPGGFPYYWDSFYFAAYFGAITGAVALPGFALAFLRDIPIWRLLVGTSIGTIIGGSIGLLASSLNPMTALAGAIAGFVLGVAEIRRRALVKG